MNFYFLIIKGWIQKLILENKIYQQYIKYINFLYLFLNKVLNILFKIKIKLYYHYDVKRDLFYYVL